VHTLRITVILVLGLLSGCYTTPTQQNTYPTIHKVVGVSMVPTIMPGAVAVASPYPYEQLMEGDIVIFDRKRFGLIVHRLHRKVAGGWTTKGDNNNVVDRDAMTEWNYKGKVTIFANP